MLCGSLSPWPSASSRLRRAATVLNNNSRTAEKGRLSSLGVRWHTNSFHRNTMLRNDTGAFFFCNYKWNENGHWGLLGMSKRYIGFHEMGRNSLLTEELLAFPKGLCSLGVNFLFCWPWVITQILWVSELLLYLFFCSFIHSFIQTFTYNLFVN